MVTKLYCFVGPSGSGKSTIMDALEERGLKAVKSYTDRPRRFETEDTHIFLSKRDFDLLKDKAIETKFDKYRYCTTFEQLNECSTFAVDPVGVSKLKENESKIKDFVIIYLNASPMTCLARMIAQGRDSKRANVRSAHDIQAFAGFIFIADYVIDASKSFDFVLGSVLDIIKKEEQDASFIF